MSSLTHPTGGVLGGALGLSSTELLGPLALGSEEEPVTAIEPNLGTAAWLLDLQIGGRVLRYSTRDVVVSDARGLYYLYRAGLGDFAIALTGLQDTQGFQVVDRSVDWAELAAMGEPLPRAQGTLRHWVPGELLESALVVLAGAVIDPEYGKPTAPAQFVATLKADADGERLYPDEQARVDSSTWDHTSASLTYDLEIEGYVYPTIFGYPGEGDDIASTPEPVLPAPLVIYDQAVLATVYLLLGQGVLDCVGGQVWMQDPEADAATGYNRDWLDAVTLTDNLGQVVTVAELPFGSPIEGAPGRPYYFGMSRASGKGGGTLTQQRDRPLGTLLDAALFCLRYSGRQVDLQAQEAEFRLSEYAVDGMLNERVELVDWFEGELQPLFPIVRARSGKGLYWRFVNWWATAVDAVAHLDADRGQVTRDSSVRTPEGEIANHFSIEFQMGAARGGARRTLTAEFGRSVPWYDHPDKLYDDRIVGSPVCARSQSIYGLREAETIEAPYCWKQSTAVAILRYFAVRDAFPRATVAYTGPALRLRALRRGDVVTLTDSTLHWDTRVALVDAVELSPHRLATLSLSVLDPRRLG